MPEGPEIRIMSDYVNHVCQDKKFIDAYHVQKGNMPHKFTTDELPSNNFTIQSDFSGKKLIVNLSHTNNKIPIYLFMGMSGSIKWVKTEKWLETKYVRLKFDSDDGYSLIVYGGYLGPKYSLFQNFKNKNDDLDMFKNFDEYKTNIYNSLQKKVFDKPIFEVLLDQKYFAGIGNYLRSTILFYADLNPFDSARKILNENSNFIELCRDILQKSYELNGGQLKDWTNPFQSNSEKFDSWVFYNKGIKIKDSSNRTFWFDPKWKT